MAIVVGRRLLSVFLFFLIFLAVASASAQPTITDMTPRRGEVGQQVTLSGADFDTQESYGITVDGTAATVGVVTETSLTFTIGAGTGSGAVEIMDANGTRDSGFSFTVTRQITGTIDLPDGVTLPGYMVAGGGEFVTPSPSTGAFSLTVPADGAAMITVFREEADPAFMAVATSEASSFVVNSESTARALVFVSPLIMTRVDQRARDALTRIAGKSETQALASHIQSFSANNRDYLNDARIQTALLAATQAALAASPSPAKAGVNPPSTLMEINPDLVGNIPSTPVRLKHTLTPPTNAHPAHFLLNVDSKGRNPVDWITEIYELRPGQFPAGRQSIANIEHTEPLAFLDPTPTHSGFVRAKLDGKKLDLIERLAEAIFELAFSGDPTLEPNNFFIEREVAGVFVAQSYSGNLWYGTSSLLPSSNQSALLNSVDKNQQWRNALAANIVVASLDAVAFFLDVKEVVPDGMPDLIQTILTDVNKALAAHAANQGPGGGITLAFVYDVSKAGVVAVVKFVSMNAFEGTATQITLRLSKTLGKILSSTIDLLSKISAAEQALERTVGFTTPDTLAIERAVVVVGNPFEPRIRSFRPQSGKTGDQIHISGYNFPTGNGELTVRFCNFTQTVTEDDDLETIPITAQLQATVIAVEPNSVVIEVPDGWEALFNTKEAFLCVENTNGDQTRTTSLADPNRLFQFIGDPEVEFVEPNPKIAKGLLRIHGNHFDAEGRLLNEVLVDGTPIEVVNASSTDIVARLPSNLAPGSYTAQVRFNDATSPPLNFTVEDPSASFTVGLQITITKADLSNVADGEISVLEAFLLANGTLGRAIEQHAPGEFIPLGEPGHIPFTRRETDHVIGDNNDGFGGGAGLIDFIVATSGLTGQVVAMTQPLPTITLGDRFDFNGLILDGAGGGGGADGLRLDGVTDWNLKGLTLRNFSGHGVHLLNGARGNRLENIRVENCGGNGVFLNANATENDLIDMKVSVAGGHGLHVTGAGVRYNSVTLTPVGVTSILGLYEDCVGHGVLVDGGATFNVIHPGTVRNNGATGILVTGPTTDHNVIGRNSNVVPRYNDIYNNNGHGVHLTTGVEGTVLRYLNPAGNQGDGIRLEGPDCMNNQCDGIFTGIDYYTNPTQPSELPNTGNGIHLLNGAHHNLLGSRTPGGFGERGGIVANDGAGILIDGEESSFNTINRMNIGDNFSAVVGGGTGRFPNGTHGIHLRNGTHDNVLGAAHSFLDLHISAQPNGAGILIEGDGTDFNQIFGNQIGTDHGDRPSGDGRLEVGIWIRDGAQGNVVGELGDFLQVQSGNFDPFRPFNVIVNATRAGVIIENAGGEYNVDGDLIDANIVQNNFIGVGEFNNALPNQTGVVLTNNARLNFIGGPLASQGNRIHFNDDAGISIDNNALAGMEDSNRIQNNEIRQTGNGVAGGGITDPLASVPPGVGVLITGSSVNNQVGAASSAGNHMKENLVGVYIDGAQSNAVFGASIYSNTISGVIVRSGQGNRIGSVPRGFGNTITDNGANAVNEGGVVLTGGLGNRVSGNFIGATGPGQGAGGNNGAGIVIRDSAQNAIGGDFSVFGNVIANNASHGIHVAGAGSSGNDVKSNLIGTDRGAVANLNNIGNGVLLDGGASGNLIGGKAAIIFNGGLLAISAGNTITFNLMNGVEVSGGGTTGNSILDNSITANTLAGIAHSAGGNDNIPPPIQATFDGDVITGMVPSLNDIPVGSTIQIFSDTDVAAPEGAAILGEGVVLTGGQWTIDKVSLPIFSKLTMTATDGNTGETSMFGTDIDFQLGLSVTRAGSATPGGRNLAMGAGVTPVMNLQVGALNADAQVFTMTFNAAGSLDDVAHITGVSLYRDTDLDGKVTEADVLLADVAAYDANDGAVTLTLNDARLAANVSQHWLVAYNATQAPAEGLTFSLQLTSAQSVGAEFIFPIGLPAVPAPPFPVVSDTFTIKPGVSLDAWKQEHFSAAELMDELISGNAADPDGDGIINIVEYALGLDPRVADGAGLPITRIDGGKLIVEYNRSTTATDVDFAVKVSADLLTQLASTGVIEEVSVTDNEDGTERVVLRTINDVSADPQLFVLLQIVLNAAAP